MLLCLQNVSILLMGTVKYFLVCEAMKKHEKENFRSSILHIDVKLLTGK